MKILVLLVPLLMFNASLARAEQEPPTPTLVSEAYVRALYQDNTDALQILAPWTNWQTDPLNAQRLASEEPTWSLDDLTVADWTPDQPPLTGDVPPLAWVLADARTSSGHFIYRLGLRSDLDGVTPLVYYAERQLSPDP